MKNPNDNFLKGRLRSLTFALRGAWLLVTTEHSIMVQLSIAFIMTVIGFIMGISAQEWMFQLLAIGLVLVAESLNTGIEKLSDFVHPEYHKRIGFIKDISAGAATFAAIIAIIIGLIIYVPKFS
jgi:diacylglycerol kinase (ATP)